MINIWDNPSHWLSYFSRWLKPPTRLVYWQLEQYGSYTNRRHRLGICRHDMIWLQHPWSIAAAQKAPQKTGGDRWEQEDSPLGSSKISKATVLGSNSRCAFDVLLCFSTMFIYTDLDWTWESLFAFRCSFQQAQSLWGSRSETSWI